MNEYRHTEQSLQAHRLKSEQACIEAWAPVGFDESRPRNGRGDGGANACAGDVSDTGLRAGERVALPRLRAPANLCADGMDGPGSGGWNSHAH